MNNETIRGFQAESSSGIGVYEAEMQLLAQLTEEKIMNVLRGSLSSLQKKGSSQRVLPNKMRSA